MANEDQQPESSDAGVGIRARARAGASARVSRWLLMGVGLALLAWLIWRYRQELSVLRGVSARDVLVLVILNLAGRLVISEGVRVQLRALGYRLGSLEAFSTMLGAAYGNLFVPYGGLVVPAAYLKRQHGAPLMALGASGAILAVFQVAALALLGLAAWPFLPPGEAHRWLGCGLAALLAAIVGGIVLLSHPRGPVAALARKSPRIQVFGQAWMQTFTQGAATPLACLGLQAAGIAIRMGRLYWCYRAIGAPAGAAQIVILTLLGDLAVLSSITPNGVGIREAVMSYGGGIVGVGTAATAAAALLDRVVLTAVIAVAAQLAMGHLLGRLHQPATVAEGKQET